MGNECPLIHRETGNQPYTDCILSAGLVDGHPHDDIYLKFARQEEEPTVIYVRRDEALAIIWLLAGALWSGEIEPC